MEKVFQSQLVAFVAIFFLCFSLPVPTRAQTTSSSNGDGGTTGSSQPLPESNGTHQVINTDTHKAVPLTPSQINVVVLLEKPFVMRSKVDPTKFEGLLIDVLENITTSAGLPYNIVSQPEVVYGYEHTPGNWTGLIGKLVDKKVHLAIAPLSIVSKRSEVVEFTQPIMSSGLRILYKPANPWTDTASFTLLWTPFTVGTWMVLLLMFAAVSVLFYVIGRFSPYEDHAFVGKAATYEGLTLVNSFLYVFSSLTFQGYTAAPRSMSGRVLAAFWWMFVLLVIAAYTASLCAVFLAFKPSITSMPFATFDELSQQSHVAYGVVAGGVTEQYLKSSKQPLQRRLWGTINANYEAVTVKSTQEGVHRVRATPGQYAFIMEGPMAEYLSEQSPCDLVTVGEELNQRNWGFACQKDSDVCSKLNPAILRMRGKDLIYDLKKKWLHQGCNRDDTAEYIYQGVSYIDTFGSTPKYYADRSVTLRRFGMGFLCIIVGMIASTVVLVGEIFHAKRRGSPIPQRMSRGGTSDQERIDREYRDDDDN